MDKNLFIHCLGVMVSLGIFVFLLTLNFIGYGVREQCNIAQGRYDGDCVEALSQYLDDENNGYYSRNSAIWALGQLGDERALPVLQKYYTDYSGGRGDRSVELSQLELKRAIGYMEGNLNIPKLLLNY
ncbi:MAG: HEAT repeat domain-containing protein [Patescibacteria group bacterium]|jgi:HEAT repeat protein